jgi:aminoglycoside 2'-N-acetyltransferase I
MSEPAAASVTLVVQHTSQVSLSLQRRIRALLADAFDGFNDDDWEHALGGVHALAWEAGELIGHASVVQRRLLYRGRPLRVGYVEAVAVHPSRQRAGIGGLLMAEMERVIAGAYELGALSTSDAVAFYLARGWQPWRGATAVMAPSGLVPTPEEDGGVLVFEVAERLDLDAPLACDFRGGDVW